MTEQISNTTSADISIEQLQQELAEALAKAEENLSGWKRAQADMENYRKRKEQESSEWVAFGKQAGFVQILPVLDSLQQAMVHAPDIADEKYQNWKNGLQAIIKQIDDASAKLGIQKIAALGQKFDPHLHEAIKEVPAAEGQAEGIITEEFQTGYLINDKLLRPAQVAITKKGN